jgi:hypothetical protein
MKLSVYVAHRISVPVEAIMAKVSEGDQSNGTISPAKLFATWETCTWIRDLLIALCIISCLRVHAV